MGIGVLLLFFTANFFHTAGSQTHQMPHVKLLVKIYSLCLCYQSELHYGWQSDFSWTFVKVNN